MGHQDSNEKTQVESCRISKTMSSESVEIAVQGPPREDLIKTAVNFLSNPNVQKSPATQKEAFLRKKGLTPDEIRIAFERCLTQVPVYGAPLALQHMQVGQLPVQNLAPVPWYHKVRDILNTVALFVGSVYGLYYLYKRFIAPFLFGKPKKPKAINDTLNELNEKVSQSFGELKADLERVHVDLDKLSTMQNEQQTSMKKISELKSEITTVKGILLSRHQFPSVNLSSTSIPAWQISSSTHEKDKDGESDDVEHTSGSSETEIVNANSNGGSQGSDSSLEMIKEVDA